MTRRETPFVTDGDLIIVRARVSGPRGTTRGRFVLDTGAVYILRVAELAVLGFAMSSFPVHVFDLGHDDIDGLVGLNFLSELNYEVRSAERRILVEEIEP
jgi:hypothetical protein